MIRKYFHIFIALLLVLLVGCSAKGPLYQAENSSKGVDPEFVIYRPDWFRAGGQSVEIRVDEREIGTLKNGGWLVIPTSIGSHTISGKPNGEKSFSIPALVADSKRYFFRITPSDMKNVFFIPLGNLVYSSATFGAWTIDAVPEEQAKKELAKLKRSD